MRPQYSSTPHPLFPTYPRTVRGPWRAQFYSFSLMNNRISVQLGRSSVHFHNDPLRSCRKIGGKTVIQKSLSRQPRRMPNWECTLWLFTKNERSAKNNQKKTSSSLSHHHDNTPPKQHSRIYSGTGPIHPVHDRLTLLDTENVLRIRFLSFWRRFEKVGVLRRLVETVFHQHETCWKKFEGLLVGIWFQKITLGTWWPAEDCCREDDPRSTFSNHKQKSCVQYKFFNWYTEVTKMFLDFVLRMYCWIQPFLY